MGASRPFDRPRLLMLVSTPGRGLLFPHDRSEVDVEAQATVAYCNSRNAPTLICDDIVPLHRPFHDFCVFPLCPCDARVSSIPENISGEILKAVQSIYPMQNVYIRKVKALKKPKFDRECYIVLLLPRGSVLLGSWFLSRQKYATFSRFNDGASQFCIEPS